MQFARRQHNFVANEVQACDKAPAQVAHNQSSRKQRGKRKKRREKKNLYRPSHSHAGRCKPLSERAWIGKERRLVDAQGGRERKEVDGEATNDPQQASVEEPPCRLFLRQPLLMEEKGFILRAARGVL